VIQLAKSQNITSIADFIAARYGKSQAVAATVAVIAIIGSVPISRCSSRRWRRRSRPSSQRPGDRERTAHRDMALIVTLAMAAFAVLFGTRQTDATEHQHGLMLAIATESIVKLWPFSRPADASRSFVRPRSS
jgi:Na+/proline symporter